MDMLLFPLGLSFLFLVGRFAGGFVFLFPGVHLHPRILLPLPQQFVALLPLQDQGAGGLRRE